MPDDDDVRRSITIPISELTELDESMTTHDVVFALRDIRFRRPRTMITLDRGVRDYIVSALSRR